MKRIGLILALLGLTALASAAPPARVTVRDNPAPGATTTFPAAGKAYDIWNNAYTSALQNYIDSRAAYQVQDANAIAESTVAALPTCNSGARNQLRRVTDNIRGTWICDGTNWRSVTGYADVRDFATSGSGSVGSQWAGWGSSLTTSGDRVLATIHPGYYTTGSSVTILDDKVRVQGTPGAVMTATTVDAPTLTVGPTASTTARLMDTVIDGLTLSNNAAATNDNAAGLVIETSDGARVSNVTVENGSSGIRTAYGPASMTPDRRSWGTTIIGATLRGLAKLGVELIWTRGSAVIGASIDDPSNAATLHALRVTGDDQTGSGLPPAQDNVLIGNRTRGHLNGISVQTGTQRTAAIGNITRSPTGYGAEVYSTSANAFMGNIHSGGANGALINDVTYSRFDEVITGTTGRALRVRSTADHNTITYVITNCTTGASDYHAWIEGDWNNLDLNIADCTNGIIAAYVTGSNNTGTITVADGGSATAVRVDGNDNNLSIQTDGNVRIDGSDGVYRVRVEGTLTINGNNNTVLGSIVGVVTDSGTGNNVNGTKLPVYTTAGLPTCTDGQRARLSDGIRGLWICRGTTWQSLTGYADVRDFGAVGDDSTDNTTAITNWLAAVSAEGSGTAYLADGTYRIAPTASTVLGTFTSGQGITIIGPGVIRDVQTYTGSQTATLFRFIGGSNITIGPLKIISTATTTTSTNLDRGLIVAKFEQGVQGITFDLELDGGYQGVVLTKVYSDPASYSSRHIRGRIKATGVHYPYTSQFSGDDAQVSLVADTCGRAYFLYGVHNVTIDAHTVNPQKAALIHAYSGYGTRNVTITHYDRDTTDAEAAMDLIGIYWGDSTPATHANLRLYLDTINNGGAADWGHTVVFRKYLNGDGVTADTTGRGHVLDGLMISGIVDQISGNNGIRFATGAFAATDVVRRLHFDDLRLSGPSTSISITSLLATGVPDGPVILSGVRSAGTITLGSPAAEEAIYHGSTSAAIEYNTVQRYKALGTSLVAGDISLSAGWGSTASVSSISGTDQRFELTITSAGTGQGASPTVILTFTDGTWTTAPFYNCVRNGGAQATIYPTVSETATALTMTFPLTPVAAETFTVRCQAMG